MNILENILNLYLLKLLIKIILENILNLIKYISFSIKMSKANPNIFLYVANILDYFRVIFAVIAFYNAKTSPQIFIISYFLSFSLDLFDGMAARYFNQKSKLGATLDMVIDRISTAGLLMVLSVLYNEISHYFIFLMMLDVGSHWLQTHSGFMDIPETGQLLKDNHKSLEEKFWILNFYYKNKYGLFTVCLGAELFLLSLYIAHYNKFLFEDFCFVVYIWIVGTIYTIKQLISVIQVIAASQRIARFDVMEYHLAEKAK